MLNFDVNGHRLVYLFLPVTGETRSGGGEREKERGREGERELCVMSLHRPLEISNWAPEGLKAHVSNLPYLWFASLFFC